MSALPNTGNPTPAPDQPVTQASKSRAKRPEWLRRFPKLRPDPIDTTFQLIPPDRLEKILATVNPSAADRIRADVKFLELPLLRLFRERDHEAYVHQNTHRLFQLSFIGLSVLATLIGSLLTLSLTSNATLAAVFGFIEAVIASVTAMLAALQGNRPPQALWLQNRLRAEYLRREYYRFLMNLEPYTSLEEVHRRRMLEMRAAEINKGTFPETPTELESVMGVRATERPSAG
ncbi:MAG: DUF4231 domain-containing protein [Anaerolineae bacterium]|jgi:hypothetical protein|nr:DUF4231 domain-containing protein [Anaerolineae bacterium]